MQIPQQKFHNKKPGLLQFNPHFRTLRGKIATFPYRQQQED
jgi:hypothetical protein